MKKTLYLFSVSLLLCISCKDEQGSSGTEPQECQEGYEGCACTPEGWCIDPALKCASGVCVDPGDFGDGDGDGDGAGDGDGDGDPPDPPLPPDLGNDCDPGTYQCECDNGACDPGLECEDEVCIVNECLVQYESCFDNDDGWLGECCDDLLCIGSELSNVWGCAPQCLVHSDCPTTCCVELENHGTWCSQAGCTQKCINTCGALGVYDGSYTGDGYCDDGGPGSDFELCELGTDCSDCGPR